MKKIATIALLILLLFNFVGYRLVFYALQQHADKELVVKLDNNSYADADLITISVPLSLPYLTNWKDFERTDGEITLNGKIYHYVKQKVYEGQLILKCLPDEQKMHLQTAKDDFFKLANELQNNSSSKKSNGGTSDILKFVNGSVYDNSQNTNFDFLSVNMNSLLFNQASSYSLQKGEGLTPEQPPEA